MSFPVECWWGENKLFTTIAGKAIHNAHSSIPEGFGNDKEHKSFLKNSHCAIMCISSAKKPASNTDHFVQKDLWHPPFPSSNVIK